MFETIVIYLIGFTCTAAQCAWIQYKTIKTDLYYRGRVAWFGVGWMVLVTVLWPVWYIIGGMMGTFAAYQNLRLWWITRKNKGEPVDEHAQKDNW